MTALQILPAGLVHLCTPGAPSSWPYRVQDELDTRDAAARAEGTAVYGSREWLAAQVARVGAETRLAVLLDVPLPGALALNLTA